MNTKIVQNVAKKSVTIIISKVSFNYVDNLYEKYKSEKGDRYFATGVLVGADYTKDLFPFLKDLCAKLNEAGKEVLPKGEVFVPGDLISLKEDEVRLITRNLDKDGKWDNQFKINLSSKSAEEGKRFLFKDLAQKQPIDKKDGWKHLYAIEIEMGVGYDEDKCERYVYTVFHRAVSVGMKENVSSFEKNDNAWEGFDFGTMSEEDSPF